MPWALYDAGKASEVAERLKTLVQGQGEDDIAQFNSARDFALKELESLKPDQEVKIDAGGTRSDKQFSIRFSLYTKQL
jgi:hypothetical protein